MINSNKCYSVFINRRGTDSKVHMSSKSVTIVTLLGSSIDPLACTHAYYLFYYIWFKKFIVLFNINVNTSFIE